MESRESNDPAEQRRRNRKRHISLLLLLLPLTLLAAFIPGSCSRDSDSAAPAPAANALVVYTSVDEPIATPILKAFEQKTGIRVDVRTDTEATKSVGLVERLIAEKANPRADVFWGNEVFLTMRLAEEGVLAPYESPAATDVPQQFRDPQHRWTGSALRARVIVVQGAKIVFPSGASYPPTKLADLLDPSLKNQIAIARPTAGTTGSHVAALYAKLGEEPADLFFRGLRANGVKMLGGNSVVAREVSQGNLLAGLTDNDDVAAVNASGGSAQAILPDQQPADGDTAAFGTLVLPCTVGVVNGTKRDAAARQLVDYLLSPEVEQQLIAAKFAAYSVRDPASIKTMAVDYREVARLMPLVVPRAMAILDGR
ncbi:MAG TPA: extracellular solute-binding protein [Tepidisphaeraceae bacterium]|jgi:iron(III) transport system substrate-binding protein|nr:extracellular solute-binding protein [Tepidisphaeraceae bacterium]